MNQVLDPAGPGAREAARLWWLMLGAGGTIYLVVIGVLLIAVLRRRRTDDNPISDLITTRWSLLGGAVLPAVVLSGLFLVVLRSLGAGASDPRPGELVVEITGRQWWWEIRYRVGASSEPLISANELHIPAGRRIAIRLTSADVIHSFWVPRLQGKTDLVPGMTTVSWIEADTAGVYGGRCAEYCGLQHARMALLVVAHDPEEFARWLARERRPGTEAADSLAERGRTVFLGKCASCHTVRGIEANGRAGPDLTHVASRFSLAAGTLRNNLASLGGWIVSAQHLKPGSGMPNVPLTAEHFRSLLHYLQTLK
jgi:cytochrome c oxidase subunit II